MLKAMGATNWMIRKIFLIQAGMLITRGIVIGNTIGLAFIGIQYWLSPLS
jgi:lipoprotein-releasing system permease protein